MTNTNGSAVIKELPPARRRGSEETNIFSGAPALCDAAVPFFFAL